MSRTISLNPLQWQVLVIHGSQMIAQEAASSACPPTAETVARWHNQLDEVKLQISAWVASAPRIAQEQPMIVPETTQSIPLPEPPKRKPGWPKGKKRGPRKSANAGNGVSHETRRRSAPQVTQTN